MVVRLRHNRRVGREITALEHREDVPRKGRTVFSVASEKVV